MQRHKKFKKRAWLSQKSFVWSIVFVLLGSLASCSSTPPPRQGGTDSLQDLQAMGTPTQHDTSKDANKKKIRYQAIQETALSIGAQSGLAWQSKNIDKQLERQSGTLDRIYAFNALVLDHNILPPILLEGRNILNQADANTIRIADRRYKIARQARFITTAPTWRQYLWMDYIKPDRPNDMLLPETEYEQELWDYYVAVGWGAGVRQAGVIFSNNVARLKEDFNGMILYRKLLAQNMVSPPYVAHTDLGVTGDQGEINIDDQVLRITALPQLNPDSNNWNPFLAVNKKELIRYNKMQKLVKNTPIVLPSEQLSSNERQPVISNMSHNE